MVGSKFEQLRKKEKQARKQVVVESALTLFEKRPFYEVGMRDVAQEAGISAATIYRYFPSQEELFNEAFLQLISTVSEDFKILLKKEKPASIEAFGIKLARHFMDNESTFQMMAYLMLKDNLTNPVIGQFDSVTKIFFDLFEKLLIKHGVDDTNIRLYAHSYIASIAGILMTFRNVPLKNKKATREHILKIVRITSDLFSRQLIYRLNNKG